MIKKILFFSLFATGLLFFSIKPTIAACDPTIIETPSGTSDINTVFTILVTGLEKNRLVATRLVISGPTSKTVSIPYTDKFQYELGKVKIGTYVVKVERETSRHIFTTLCSRSFYVGDVGTKPGKAYNPCEALPPDSDEKNECQDCLKGEGKYTDKIGSWTALGCIPTDPDKLVMWILQAAINIVGGIAFLLILFGSFKVATSSGNPESLNEGKDIIFAALAGLLFIVFSVVLLKIIGSDILQIPGFQ